MLFTPLGISDVGWGQYPDSIPAAASGLQLRPRDLAKIGQLVLNRGLWGGQRIVSEQWIDEATVPQIGPADRIYFYGYQWWLGRSLIKRREFSWVAGIGLGGQRLFIVPALDLICVVTAGHYTENRAQATQMCGPTPGLDAARLRKPLEVARVRGIYSAADPHSGGIFGRAKHFSSIWYALNPKKYRARQWIPN